MAKKIFFAVMNWGLGHASRSIPIIKKLQQRGIELIVGSDGVALALLQKEFPTLQFVELPAYNVHYRSNNMILNIAPQVPKLIYAINKERRYIKNIISTQQIDAIISDNRFGIFDSRVYAVFITHQLNILIPNPLIAKWVNHKNANYIRRYHQCWVPDYSGAKAIAPALSAHNGFNHLRYIGPVSRMQTQTCSKEYDITVVLSGVEPQRSYLEKAIIEQLKNSSYRVVIVSGNTLADRQVSIEDNIERIPYLCTKELNALMLSSRLLICRSGYSSIMDIHKLGIQKVLFIPTPGQTEQEYLAEQLSGTAQFRYQKQVQLDLLETVAELLEEPVQVQKPKDADPLLDQAIDDLLSNI